MQFALCTVVACCLGCLSKFKIHSRYVAITKCKKEHAQREVLNIDDPETKNNRKRENLNGIEFHTLAFSLLNTQFEFHLLSVRCFKLRFLIMDNLT